MIKKCKSCYLYVGEKDMFCALNKKNTWSKTCGNYIPYCDKCKTNNAEFIVNGKDKYCSDCMLELLNVTEYNTSLYTIAKSYVYSWDGDFSDVILYMCDMLDIKCERIDD